MTFTKVHSKAFYALQKKWYGKLEADGFFDIENGLDSPPILRQHGGGANSVAGLNAVQAKSGRPMQALDSFRQGSEWEQLISETDMNVDTRRSPSGTYMHYAQLIASQEYELCRLGSDRGASRQRLAWALHAQGFSERYLAKVCEATRHEIRSYIAMLDAMIHIAIDRAS